MYFGLIFKISSLISFQIGFQLIIVNFSPGQQSLPLHSSGPLGISTWLYRVNEIYMQKIYCGLNHKNKILSYSLTLKLDHGDTKSNKFSSHLKNVTLHRQKFEFPWNTSETLHFQVDAESEMQKTTFILKYQKFAPCQNLAHVNINMFELSSSLPSLKTRLRA